MGINSGFKGLKTLYQLQRLFNVEWGQRMALFFGNRRAEKDAIVA